MDCFIPKKDVKQLSRKDNIIKFFNPIKHVKLGSIQFTFNERCFNFVAPYLIKEEAPSKTSTSSVTDSKVKGVPRLSNIS